MSEPAVVAFGLCGVVQHLVRGWQSACHKTSSTAGLGAWVRGSCRSYPGCQQLQAASSSVCASARLPDCSTHPLRPCAVFLRPQELQHPTFTPVSQAVARRVSYNTFKHVRRRCGALGCGRASHMRMLRAGGACCTVTRSCQQQVLPAGGNCWHHAHASPPAPLHRFLTWTFLSTSTARRAASAASWRGVSCTWSLAGCQHPWSYSCSQLLPACNC